MQCPYFEGSTVGFSTVAQINIHCVSACVLCVGLKSGLEGNWTPHMWY